MILFVEHWKCANEIKLFHPFPPLHSVRTRNVCKDKVCLQFFIKTDTTSDKTNVSSSSTPPATPLPQRRKQNSLKVSGHFPVTFHQIQYYPQCVPSVFLYSMMKCFLSSYEETKPWQRKHVSPSFINFVLVSQRKILPVHEEKQITYHLDHIITNQFQSSLLNMSPLRPGQYFFYYSERESKSYHCCSRGALMLLQFEKFTNEVLFRQTQRL